MNREQWLAERKKGIGASEAAAVLGVAPENWDSAVTIWAKKKGIIPEAGDDERFLTGRLFEDPIAQLYAARERVQVTGGGYDLRWHPRGLPVFATPDRLLVDVPRGLEIKTVEPFMAHAWGEEGTDQVPSYYITQCAVCMAVTDLPEWDLAAFFSLHDIRVYRLQRDLELEEAILSRLTEFWTRYVVGNEEPAIDGSEACATYLSTKYPMNRLPLIGANEEAEGLLQNLFAIREQVKSDEAIQTEYENRLKEIIGEAEGIQGVCGKVTWRLTKESTKVEWEAVARALNAPADLITQHTIVKPGSRRFLPTATKR